MFSDFLVEPGIGIRQPVVRLIVSHRQIARSEKYIERERKIYERSGCRCINITAQSHGEGEPPSEWEGLKGLADRPEWKVVPAIKYIKPEQMYIQGSLPGALLSKT